MGRIRRGGYFFVTWAGDHTPRHVHVYRDNVPVLKWNLETWERIAGQSNRQILQLLSELREEGLL